jgi:hypothetical protein
LFPFHFRTLLINSRVVILRIAYRGPPDVPIDTANLRRTLNLYTGAKHISLAWNTSIATPLPESLPQLPPIRPTAPVAPTQSNLQSLSLGLTGTKLKDWTTPLPKVRADTGEIFTRHLNQLLPVVLTPSLRALNLSIAFFDTGFGVRDGLSVFVNALEGVQQPGLTRLGITGFYDLKFRKEVSQKWVRE